MVTLLTVYQGVLSENVGLHRIEAFLKQNNIDVKTIYISSDMVDDELTISLIAEADIVGISVFAYVLPQTAQLVQNIKSRKKNICIFVGSQYFTACYNTVIKYIPQLDFGILGHGEYPILEFINNYNGSNIEELVKGSPFLVNKFSYNNKKVCITDINKLPWPTHKKEILERDLFAYLNTSHGCVGNCSFCGHVRNPWTGRKPNAVIDEILYLNKKFGICAFSFSDNSFEDPGEKGKQRLDKIATGIISLNKNLALNAFIRADSFSNSVKDINLLKKLRAAGLNQCLVGIEAGNEADLLLYNKRATLAQGMLTLDLFKACDIHPAIGFININPYSSSERMKENHNFLKKICNYFPGHYFSYLTVYENTAIYHKIKEDNLLIDEGYNFSYLIYDEFAGKYFEFIKNEYLNTEFSKSMFELQNLIKMCNYFIQIFNDHVSNEELERIKNELCQCNNYFFDTFFASLDFAFLYEKFEKYRSEVMYYTKEIYQIYSRLLHKYYRHRKKI